VSLRIMRILRSHLRDRKGSCYLDVVWRKKRPSSSTVAAPKGWRHRSGGHFDHESQDSLQKAGNPFLPIRIEPYRKVPFRLALSVKVHPDHQTAKVLPAVDKQTSIDLLF